MAQIGGVDRLSDLPDDILGHILSFLPTTAEAGRAAVLSSRWRHVFAHVNTLSFQAVKQYNFWSDAITFYLDSQERRSTNGYFVDRVNAALLAHRRCARLARNTSLRVFRVAFHAYQGWDKDMVTMWISHALEQSGHELHLDLRLHTYQRCHRGDGRSDDRTFDRVETDGLDEVRFSSEEEDDGCSEDRLISGGDQEDDGRSEDRFSGGDQEDDGRSEDRLPSDNKEDDGRSEDGFTSDEEDKDVYIGGDERRGRWNGWSFSFPRPLFSSAVLRSLRVSHGWLNPPAAIILPSLETLHLTNVPDSEETIQRLISSCPRLADLTLESCSKLIRVSFPDKRLRRFALLCCHSMVSVSLDASELHFLHYRGAVPAGSLFTFPGSPRIPSSTIKLCGPNQSSEENLSGFRLLLENFEAAKHLHLNFSRLRCSDGRKFLVGFPAFATLHKLELTGSLDSHSIITRVLQQTPNLEILSLFLKRDPEHSPVIIPDAPAVLCLQQRLKEINLVHYRGSLSQRMLAQLLLGNALVLEALCVVFRKKSLQVKTTLMTEIKGWMVSKSPKTSFL